MRGHGLPCEYCKREMRGDVPAAHPLRATKDHTIPKSKRNGKGGPHLIVMACYTCNQTKGDRFPEQWERFMQRNPRWWEFFEDRPTRPATKPSKAVPLPIEHSKYILEHGKRKYKLWVTDGCPVKVEMRPLRGDEPIPLRYDDPVAQAAFEGAYQNRKWLLRVPQSDGGGQPLP